MASPSFNPTHGTVTNESCPLHYWSLGASGPLILFVPGGNGHGRQFNAMLAALSTRGFTCATFDRRQMSSSQPATDAERVMLSPPQQARDIRAVIAALGFAKAIVFGSSSGGIFALQFAHDFPGMVDHVISHEAPLTNLLPAPTSGELYDWFWRLIGLWRAGERERAAAEFGAGLIGYADEGIPKTVSPEPGNAVTFWEYEMPTLTGYVPNLWRLVDDGTSVGVMRGVRSRDAFFAQAVDEVAKVLACPMMMVPGHHQAFEVETEEFLPCFLEMLEILETRRAEKKK
ncbi:Alpha/Beta hydrolase protein [Podospora conica]|nr:Alpha/Beta hydrolase protein [Schizothecium conicum]